MLYLRSALLPDSESEFLRLAKDKIHGDMTCFGSRYPFGIFPAAGLEEITFAPVTIFAGGNGSGKSTLLNVLAEKLRLPRTSPINCTPYFRIYADLCTVSADKDILSRGGRIITSDDVFQYILHSRQRNAEIDDMREALLAEYWEKRKDSFRLTSLTDTAKLKDHNDRQHRTPSRYVGERLKQPENSGSNGEHALKYFTEAIGENALYLLDEPENSLSVLYQEKLVSFLCDSVRFFGCQLVIATHSPILLSIPGARIYDLDARPITVKNWTELPNVRALYDFFREHDEEFS